MLVPRSVRRIQSGWPVPFHPGLQLSHSRLHDRHRQVAPSWMVVCAQLTQRQFRRQTIRPENLVLSTHYVPTAPALPCRVHHSGLGRPGIQQGVKKQSGFALSHLFLVHKCLKNLDIEQHFCVLVCLALSLLQPFAQHTLSKSMFSFSLTPGCANKKTATVGQACEAYKQK